MSGAIPGQASRLTRSTNGGRPILGQNSCQTSSVPVDAEAVAFGIDTVGAALRAGFELPLHGRLPLRRSAFRDGAAACAGAGEAAVS